jgi:hypothetical protein
MCCRVFQEELTLYGVSEACCLDVDWIDDSTFASGGSDRVIHIVSLNGTKPIQTLRYVGRSKHPLLNLTLEQRT